MLDLDAIQQLVNKIQPLFIGKNLEFTIGKLKAKDKQILSKFNTMVEGFDLTNILPLLAKLNRLEELDEFLDLLDITEEKEEKQQKNTSDKPILIIGRSQIAENEIKKIFKEFGIDTNRVIVQREYDELKKQGVNINPDKYSLILIGPTPHKTATTGDACGTMKKIQEICGNKVIVLENNGHPKITRNTIEQAILQAKARQLIH